MKIAEIMRKLTDACRLKHYSYATEKSYRGWIQLYSRMVLTLPPEWTSEEKAAAFLTQMAKRGVAAATQSEELRPFAKNKFRYSECVLQTDRMVSGRSSSSMAKPSR